MNQISTVSTSSKIFLSAFFVFLTISTPAYSQEANPDGIMGPYFSLSTADYPHQSNDGHYMTISASDSILLGVEDFHMEISHNGLTLWWSGQSTGSNAKFKIWGSGNIKIDIMGNEIEIGGGPSYGDPLIEISHNNSDFYLSYVDLDITADFSLFDLTMGADSLGIIYDSSDESYVFSGAASVEFEGNSLVVSLGDDTNPEGIKIVNGNIEQFIIALSGDLNIYSLEFEPDGLTFAWAKADLNRRLKTSEMYDENGDPWWASVSGASTFKMYGGMKITVGDNQVDTQFGDADNPGLNITNGTLTNLNMTINSELHFGSVTASVTEGVITYYTDETRTGVDINRDSELTDYYLFKGSVKMESLWSVEIDFTDPMSTGENYGVQIIEDDTGKMDFYLEGFEFTIENAGLGSIDFRKIWVQYSSEGREGCERVEGERYAICAGMNVLVSPGWDIDGSFCIVNNELSSVAVSWYGGVENGIEIPGAGVEIIGIGASVNNIDHPSNIEITGDVQLTYGGTITVGNTNATMIYVDGQATITPSRFTLNTVIKLAAYQEGGDWENLLGVGTVDVDMYFGHYYKIDGSIYLPEEDDWFAEAEVILYFDSKNNFDFYGDITLECPQSWSIIGGMKLAEVGGAVRWRSGYPSNSYAAGWTHIIWTVGGKVSFNNGHVSIIGGDDVDDIKDQIEDDSSRDPSRTITGYFDIEGNDINGLTVGISWPFELDNGHLSAEGPEGPLDVREMVYNENDSSLSLGDLVTDVEVNDYNNKVTLMISTENNFNDNETDNFIVPGRYYVSLAYNLSEGVIDSLGIQVINNRISPQAGTPRISRNGRSLDIAIDDILLSPEFSDSAVIYLYWHHKDVYNGRLISAAPFSDWSNIVEALDGTTSDFSASWVPEGLVKDDTYYIYGVIDDGTNVPYYTEIMGPHNSDPPIYGTVTYENGEPAEGITIFNNYDPWGTGNITWDLYNLNPTECSDSNTGQYGTHTIYYFARNEEECDSLGGAWITVDSQVISNSDGKFAFYNTSMLGIGYNPASWDSDKGILVAKPPMGYQTASGEGNAYFTYSIEAVESGTDYEWNITLSETNNRQAQRELLKTAEMPTTFNKN